MMESLVPQDNLIKDPNNNPTNECIDEKKIPEIGDKKKI